MSDAILYNHPSYIERRRILRKDQTPEEKIIWEHIRKKQLEGYLFWRQYSIGPYVVDFYCPKLRLAIEVDGGQHAKEEHMLYDAEREQYLAGLDITTLRFWNSEVSGNLSEVLEKIRNKIHKLLPLK